MKVSNFDPDFGQLAGGVGGGVGGSSTVLTTQIVESVLAVLQAGDVVYNFPTIIANLTAVGGAHMHIANEVQLADGSSTTYYLANWPDEGSVAAYVNGSRENPTISGDAVTFADTPPVLARLQFDYIAELT